MFGPCLSASSVLLGSLAVTAGYDPGDYSVVDISVEPRDGDAGHSGRSILGGSLRGV